MTKQDFYKLFAEKMQVENNLNEGIPLETFNSWDSWTRMDVMVFVDQTFQVTLTAKDIMEVKTLGDLMHKIGDQYFE
jgi:acyl carrier protein